MPQFASRHPFQQGVHVVALAAIYDTGPAGAQAIDDTVPRAKKGDIGRIEYIADLDGSVVTVRWDNPSEGARGGATDVGTLGDVPEVAPYFPEGTIIRVGSVDDEVGDKARIGQVGVVQFVHTGKDPGSTGETPTDPAYRVLFQDGKFDRFFGTELEPLQRDEVENLLLAALGLLRTSWLPIAFEYKSLTKTERAALDAPTFDILAAAAKYRKVTVTTTGPSPAVFCEGAKVRALKNLYDGTATVAHQGEVAPEN